jgi:hypothetical protein
MWMRTLVVGAASLSLASMAYGLHKYAASTTGPSPPVQLQGLAQPEPRAVRASTPHITVPSAIIAEPPSQVLLELSIEPMPEALIGTSLVLSGLPAGTSVSRGQPAATGDWEIPLSELRDVALKLPASVSGECEIVITLISGMDGLPTLLAYAKTRLIINAQDTNHKPVEIGAEASPRFAAAASKTESNRPDPSQHAKENRISDEHAQSLSGGPQPNEETRPRLPNLTPQERAHAEKLVARGLSALEDGTVAVARQFFLRAAEAKLARGALLLAATYDPQELERLGVLGVQPNLDLARKWYDRARMLGAPEAEDRLARLPPAERNYVLPRNSIGGL